MDPQLAALIMANKNKAVGGAKADEEVVESSGEVQKGEKPKFKKKPPPGAQQIGMQAMLLQEATKKGTRLKPTPKTWGVQQPKMGN